MTSSSSDAATHWNARYDRDDLLFGAEPNAWLRKHAGSFPRGGRILCVADGEGRNSVYLAQQGFRVDAFDISTRAIGKARDFAARAGVTVDFTLADADSFPWTEATHDGIAAIFVQFADPPMRARLFERMISALKPGGILILQGYTPRQLEYRTGGPSDVTHLYTEAMLREAFAPLQILVLQDYEADIAEGLAHRGRSALIGLVARR